MRATSNGTTIQSKIGGMKFHDVWERKGEDESEKDQMAERWQVRRQMIENSTENPLILKDAAKREQFGQLFNNDEYTIILSIS